MNPIIRNLISVVRRFKLAAALNILGLSVAFAAFMVIMMQLHYHHSFGKCHQEYDKIFRVERIIEEGRTSAIISRPHAERFFESSPHIVVGALKGSEGTSFFTVENDSIRNFYEESSIVVTPNFSMFLPLTLLKAEVTRNLRREVFLSR